MIHKVAEDGSCCLQCGSRLRLVDEQQQEASLPTDEGFDTPSLVLDLVDARQEAHALLELTKCSDVCRAAMELDEKLARLVLLQLVIALKRFDTEAFPGWLTS